ncbi:MAG TPA: diacylglycerol kinase family protein [Chitinophagaceae bacterium]|nr:diacylglycerol kinase family protein [Chitinophagaceae bacterium]
MNCSTNIIINPYCHQGKGWARWKLIRSSIKNMFPNAHSLILEKGVSLPGFLDHLLVQGEHYLISAGGDGTVHHLINTLVKNHSDHLYNVRIGAIGLGSSNDFIKPVRSSSAGIPTRINADRMIDHDIGKLEYLDEKGKDQTEYFIINTSLGVTAFGNHMFNDPGQWLSFLKKHCTPMAIIHTAVASLLLSRNYSCRMEFGNMIVEEELTNLNILKLPYVSGNFRYNQKIDPNDGEMSINLCHGMGLFRKMRALYQLANGSLSAGKFMTSCKTDKLTIHTKEAVLFECDGETFRSREIQISVIPKAVKVVQN